MISGVIFTWADERLRYFQHPRCARWSAPITPGVVLRDVCEGCGQRLAVRPRPNGDADLDLLADAAEDQPADRKLRRRG